MVAYATDAAQAHVAYSRALDSSRRAEVLIGNGAGQERAWAAQQHFRHRAASLEHLVGAVEELLTRYAEGHIARTYEEAAQDSAL